MDRECLGGHNLFFFFLLFKTLIYFSFFFILFFNFTILYWFCHVSTWIRHRYTRVPHPEPCSLLPPRTIPLGRPIRFLKVTNKRTLKTCSSTPGSLSYSLEWQYDVFYQFLKMHLGNWNEFYNQCCCIFSLLKIHKMAH